VAIDRNRQAYRCSCPSPRVPCKHARDLLGRLTVEPATFKETEPPRWVADWITQRRARAERSTSAEPERAEADQRKRADRRTQRIRAGLEELERWLGDLVRDGLAELPSRPRASFDQMAARLVDAQAPGLARLVRELAYLPFSGGPWTERLLVVLGRLQLAIEAWRRLETLDTDLAADLRSHLGITESRERVLASPRVHDTWSVLGRRLFVDERFQSRRTWLWGETTRRWALVLEFAAGMEDLPPQFAPGTQVDADLCFYPGALPVRALIADSSGERGPVRTLEALSVRDALHQFAEALARNPWLERQPLKLRAVIPRRVDQEWWLVDPDGAQLPMTAAHGWRLQAVSGGRPIEVVAEWDGFVLQPLSTMADGELVPLPALAA
jgi:hypothetical protein